MQYRRLGRTGLKVSAVGFGTIKLPQVDEKTAVETVRRALDLGVNFIDTARNYKDSERKIGLALRGFPREKVVVATKTVARTAKEAQVDLETSLHELQTDYVDLYQLHSVSDKNAYERVLAPGGAYEALLKAKEEGKIRHIGITMHRAIPTMRKAIESGLFETIMVAYSPLDQEGVERERILNLAREHDMGVIVMKPLSGGHLCTRERGPDEPPWRDPVVYGTLRFILSHPAVSSVIPGMKWPREVEENVPAADEPPMTEEERDALIREIGRLGKSYRYGQVCLRCEYCQPCPAGIRIPDFFRAFDMWREYPQEVRHLGLELYRALDPKPSACLDCGECEEKCPAGLPIRERLGEIMLTFEEALKSPAT